MSLLIFHIVYLIYILKKAKKKKKIYLFSNYQHHAKFSASAAWKFDELCSDEQYFFGLDFLFRFYVIC